VYTTVTLAGLAALLFGASYLPSVGARPWLTGTFDALAAFAQRGWPHVAPVVLASIASLALLRYLLLTLFNAVPVRARPRA
jgi:hypothetical protein